MNQFCQIMFRFNPRRKIQRHISIIRRCILRIWDHVLICSLGKPVRYRRMLSHRSLATDETMPSATPPPICHNHHDNDSDLVALKISLLGDCQIGKTSFLVSIYIFCRFFYRIFTYMVFLAIRWLAIIIILPSNILKAKYVGNEKDEGVKHNNGLKLMKKTLMVKDARISYSLWELDGKLTSPALCE